MATVIPVQSLPKAGKPLNAAETTQAVTLTASASAMTVENDGKTFIFIQNGAVGASTVVIEGVESPDSGRDGSTSVVVSAGEDTIVGPFKSANWNNGGVIDITIGATDPALLLGAFSYE